jgi:DNA-binding winged helix-turn-helix (wHTH) protein/tetratricopeptide (TPR) repeat protein
MAQADAYEFGSYRLDIATRSLYRGREFIALTPKVAETLLYLVEEAGHVVTKEMVMERVWPGLIVEEGGIANNISALRKIFGADFGVDGPIATVSRRGYRFTAEVRTSQRNGGGVTAEPQAASEPRSPAPITEKDTILVAEIENRTGDAVFDGTLRQALAMYLTQSPFLLILSERKVHSTLRLMGRPPELPLTADVGLELCQRTGTKAMIAGSILALGNEYVIGLQVIGAQEGDVLVSEQARASGKGDVLKALDKAALGLRTKLGESLASVQRFSIPLEEMTTASLEALKAYTVARQFTFEKGEAVALPLMLRAIEIDPGFASAYSALGIVYCNLGQATRGREYMSKGYALRERVSEHERYRITALYHDSMGDLYKALQAYDAWQRTYPRDRVSALNSGWAHMRLGQWDKALMQTEHAIETEQGSIPYVNLAGIQLALGRHADGRATLERAFARGMDAFYLHQEAYFAAFLRGDNDAMRRHAAAVAGRPGEEDLLLATQADTAAYHGRMSHARALSRRAIDSARGADAAEGAAIWQAEAALREAEVGNTQAAIDGGAAAIELAPGRDVKLISGLAFARAGNAARALELAEELGRDFPQDTLAQQYWLPSIRGAVALAQGNGAAALQALEPTLPIEFALTPPFAFGVLYPSLLRGEAYLLVGRSEEAVREFRKILDRPGLVKNFIAYPLAILGSARAHAIAGKREMASAEYERFLDLWKSADEDVPILVDARAEAARVR